MWLDVGEHETDTPAASEATVRRVRRLAELFARHGMRARKMAIPFGPFLAFGAVVALFAGDAVLDAYLSGF